MTNSGKPQSNRAVVFGRSKADQALHKAVVTYLDQHPDLSFNALCKQALQRFLLANETSASVLILMELQQQIQSLQHQVFQLEQSVQDQQIQSARSLVEQVAHLTTRLELLEQGEQTGDRSSVAASLPEPEPEPTPPPDPLLNRLGPLLDDF